MGCPTGHPVFYANFSLTDGYSVGAAIGRPPKNGTFFGFFEEK
jgi:hypothetical protein